MGGIELGEFLQNNEETDGYERLHLQENMEVYRPFAKEQIIRDRKGDSENL